MAWFISPPTSRQNSGATDFYLGRRIVTVQTTENSTGYAFVQQLTSDFAYQSSVPGSIVPIPKNGKVELNLSNYPAGYYRVVAGTSFTPDNYMSQSGNGDIYTPPLPVIYRTFITDAYTLPTPPLLTVSFDGCRRLQDADLSYHPDWRTVTHVGDMFGYRMFYRCSSLPHVGSRFSEPQSFISCGDDFNRYKFANCTALRYVSDEYTEPYYLKETGSAFCANQFSGCRSLAYVSPYYTEPLEISTSRPDSFNCYKFAGSGLSIPSPQYQDSIIQSPGNGHLAHKWDSSWT